MASASTKEVDFGAIEEGGGARVRVPEGDYPAKVKSVKFATSQSGNPMFIWEITGTDGKAKGKTFKEYTALTAKALWKLRDLMEATIGKAPGGKVQTKKLLDYCKKNVVGKPLGITVEDDEYTDDKGKTFISSKIRDYLSIDDLNSDPPEDDDELEDEDDAEVEDDEEDEDDDDGLDDLDRAGLKKHIKSEGLDVTVKKSMSDDDIREAIRAAAGDEDDDEEEEEIEDVDLDEL